MSDDFEATMSSYVYECRRQDVVLDPYDFCRDLNEGSWLDVDSERLIDLAQRGLCDIGSITISGDERIHERLESLAFDPYCQDQAGDIIDRLAGHIDVGEELLVIDDDWELVREGYDGDEDVIVYYRQDDGDFLFARRVSAVSSEWIVDVSDEFDLSPELTMMSSIRQAEEDGDDDDAKAA